MASKEQILEKADDFLVISTLNDDSDSSKKAIMFPLGKTTMLVFDTYDVELALTAAKMLDNQFEVFTLSDTLFRNMFDYSNQVVECEYIFKGIERKSTAFDLKGLESFKRRLEESTITSLTFSLENFDVIITARAEGRVSVSPDIESNTLVRLFQDLLGNGIRSIVRH